jgi:hypothetical protein
MAYTKSEVAAISDELRAPDLTNQQLAALLAVASNDLSMTKRNALMLEAYVDEIQCYLTDRLERGADLADDA